jgi:hypothetical protein
MDFPEAFGLAFNGHIERIDQFEPEISKVSRVSRRQRGTLCQRDRRDQSVHLPNSPAHALAGGAYASVLRSRRSVEWQDATAEIAIFDSIYGRPQVGLVPARCEPLGTKPQLR